MTTNIWHCITRMPSGHVQIMRLPGGNPKGLVVQHRRRAGRGDFYQAWVCVPEGTADKAMVKAAELRWREAYGLEASDAN